MNKTEKEDRVWNYADFRTDADGVDYLDVTRFYYVDGVKRRKDLAIKFDDLILLHDGVATEPVSDKDYLKAGIKYTP